ncbi:MAG TPA: DnaJ domain-containing protein [Candidatus Aveggerthella excrementigallinarum]|nr:DnaJ domain-containing protein [Candidatus Aveggerthella excrementigallinarum]
MKKSEALKILGLTDGASDDAIKSAHRKKVRENHPDQFAQNTAKHAEAEEKTKLINEARDVLLSRKWDPEFDPRRAGASNPYATPYGGASYGRPSQGSSSDPFADWPFGAGWVWTSWDDTRQTGTTGGSSRPGAGDPFSPFSSPFGTTFYAETTVTQTPQEMLKEATEELKTEALAVGVKVALMVLLSLTGNPATGVFIYVLGSLFMHFRRMGGCGWILIIPVLMLFGPWLFVLMPRAGAPISLGLGIALLFALYYDITRLREAWKDYQRAKKAAA